MALLTCRDVALGYDNKVVASGLNFTIEQADYLIIVGENGSGKTTLMKSLLGLINPLRGQIRYGDGLKANQIGYLPQQNDIQRDFPASVKEIVLSGCLNQMGWRPFYNRRDRALADYNMQRMAIADLADRSYAELSGGQQQRVLLARALCAMNKILVMDEPTSSLTDKEVKHLFKIIRSLKEKGVGIVYISHKMEELNQIADDVTIFRDGQWIATKEVKNISTDEIINLMVGRDLSDRFPPKTNKPGEVILKVENLTAKYGPSIKDVSFELRKGEILGVAGLVGSKRTDVLEALFGDRLLEEGSIYLHGKKIENLTQREAIKNGFALVTEERRETGIFGELDIEFNSTVVNVNIDKYSRGGVLDATKMKKDTQWVVDSMKVKTPKLSTKMQSLSGGNQQKVIVGRWLLTEPEILLLDEPTRGIDVGAKYEIYQLMINLANQDKGVIMVSSEMPEIFGICDRIIVMSNGRVAGIVNTNETTQEEVMRLAAKYL